MVRVWPGRSAPAAVVVCFFGWQLLLVWRGAAGPYHIRFWLVVALVPVVLSSLVSYPLHYWEILCYTVGITGVLLLHGQATALKVRVQPVVCLVWLLALTAVASWWGFEALRGRKVMHEAREWWAAGDRRMAISVLTDYCSNHPAAIPHNEMLAGWHALAGRPAMAVQVLQRHHAYHCNQEMHHELGKCYAQLGQWQQAGVHFKWSLHRTPHKLGSRATLANFYQVQQQYDSARYWAQAVASMAVKVPTLQAERLKADAAAYLQQTDTTIPFIFNFHHYTW